MHKLSPVEKASLIAVGIAIAFVAAVQLTGTVVKVEFKPHGIAESGPY